MTQHKTATPKEEKIINFVPPSQLCFNTDGTIPANSFRPVTESALINHMVKWITAQYKEYPGLDIVADDIDTYAAIQDLGYFDLSEAKKVMRKAIKAHKKLNS